MNAALKLLFIALICVPGFAWADGDLEGQADLSSTASAPTDWAAKANFNQENRHKVKDLVDSLLGEEVPAKSPTVKPAK